MKLLMIGDIVGKEGVQFVSSHLKNIKKLNDIDFCIANGENAASSGKGLSKSSASALFDSGVDAITMGNHTFNCQDIFELFNEDYGIIRPANLPIGTPGQGYMLFDVGETSICIINVSGRVFLDNLDCPFRATEGILSRVKNKANIIIVDFHAEATSEKMAFASHFSGRVSAVIGTHTHIATADERILNGGTAYITDVGMTGTTNGILGVKSEIIVNRFLTAMPARFELAEGNTEMNSVIIDIDEITGKALEIKRFSIS